MIFIHSDLSTKNIEEIDKYIEEGKDVFILIYMEGCGPCMATRPEWAKIKDALEQKYNSNNNIVVADVDKNLLDSLKYIGDIDGFPTMKYISKNGQFVESYENAPILDKERNIKSFVNWIESKISGTQKGGYSSPQKLLKRLSRNYRTQKNKKKRTHLYKKGGKWSLKYKRSINCKAPKGFSQKQYCKRKNKRTKSTKM